MINQRDRDVLILEAENTIDQLLDEFYAGWLGDRMNYLAPEEEQTWLTQDIQGTPEQEVIPGNEETPGRALPSVTEQDLMP